MKYIKIAFLFFGIVGSGAVAQNNAIEEVISAQIEAFQANDLGRAFEFASPIIKGTFGTSENFGDMVRGGYPMIWRPADVLFLDQTPVENLVRQRLRIVDQTGAAHWFMYEMVQIAGEWRINGVFKIDGPDLSA